MVDVEVEPNRPPLGAGVVEPNRPPEAAGAAPNKPPPEVDGAAPNKLDGAALLLDPNNPLLGDGAPNRPPDGAGDEDPKENAMVALFVVGENEQ